MSAESEGLQIPVGFSLEEAQLALKQLEQMAREAGKRIKGASDEAGDSFTSSLSKWRKEDKSEARQVGFLVEQFTGGLVPATGAAREGINLLTKALVGGFGLGLALDAAGAGARILVEWWGKEAKAEEAAREAAEAHRKALINLSVETQAYARSVAGTSSNLEFLYTKRREFDQQNEKDIKRRDELDALVFDNERQGITTTNDLLKEREELTKKLEKAQKDWNAAVDASFEQRRGWEQAAAAIKAQEDARADAKKRGEDKLKEMQQAGIRIRQEAEREGLTATQLVLVEFNERRKQILESDFLAQQAIVRAKNRKLLEIEREYRDKVRALADAQAQAEAEERGAVELWLQEHEKKRDAMRKEAELTLSSLSAVGPGDMGRVSALVALATETEAKLKQIRTWETEGVIATENAERLRTEITRDASQKRKELLLGEANVMRQVSQWGAEAYRNLGTNMGNEFRKSLTYSAAYSRSLRDAGKSAQETADLSAASFAKMLQDELAGLATRSLIYAAWEGAQAVASLASYNYDAAAKHGAAAGQYAIVAGLAGAGAAAIGATRGTTRAERASVSAWQESQGSYSATSLAGSTTSRGISGPGSGGSTNSREVIIYVADPFDTPQEAAQRAARRLELAKHLGLVRAG